VVSIPLEKSRTLDNICTENFNSSDMKNLQEIKDFLDLHNIDYSTTGGNFKFTGCKDGARGYEIEYVPARLYPVEHKNNGVKGVKGDYFYLRSIAAEENNSFKCWVKDYEWNTERKREVLKSYFLHAAGKTPNRFYARDCIVDVIETKEARAFELKNCFYGKRGASLNLGLRLKKDKHGMKSGELLMIYTFGLNYFGQKGDIEVLRVGTVRFSQVLGGSSKLIKYFIKNYRTMRVAKRSVPVESLIFYSDYDHNIGMSMDSLGFQFESYSKGGFMNLWLETNEVKGRQPAKHKEIMQDMRDGKVVGIANAGVKTFKLTITDEMRGDPPENLNDSW